MSGEPLSTSGTTVLVVSMLVEVPRQLDYRHEAAIPAVAREPVTVKAAEVEVASPEDEDEAIVVEVVVWVPDVAASRTRATVLAMRSLPTRSQSLKPNLPKTPLRKGHIALQWRK